MLTDKLFAEYVPNTNHKSSRTIGDLPVPAVVYEDPSETGDDVTQANNKDENDGGSLLGKLSSADSSDDDYNGGEEATNRRLKCRACDGPHCESLYECRNAVMVNFNIFNQSY